MIRQRTSLVWLALSYLAACSAKDIELTPGHGATDGATPSDVIVNASIVLPGAPEDAEALFAAHVAADVTDPDTAPRLVYPSHETMFPRNLDRVLHQWRAPEALDLFEVRFDSDVARLRFYTVDLSLLPDATTWSTLAAMHAGESLQVSVRAIRRDAPREIFRSAPITLYYSRSEVLGALYYWSTGTSGVMRAHISAPSATKFFTDPAADDAGKCVACHTVSRDGRRMAAGYDGERLRVVSVPERDVLVPTDPALPDPMMQEGPGYGWGTFSPDSTRLLYAHKGTLTLLDTSSGEALSELALPAGFRATHPDWSPDGHHVAITYVVSDREIGNKGVEGSSIARLPVTGGDAFGEPELLVESEGKDDTLFFPVYSPDSRWIAFVRAHGKSKDSGTAEIFLIAADGSGEPIALQRLNHRLRDEDGVIDLGNTMPTWAPSTRPDVFWLAFSSLRDYGDVSTDGDRDQLWGAAIDSARIGDGDDPSYAAFWMPFQDIAEGNHRAFWALAPDEACPSTTELCDSFDNDCDGVVDEDCCTPEREQCGDGLDNDCNGVADEHCECGQVDVCGNARDDDCDVAVDEDCLI